MADERVEQDLLSEIEDSQFFTDFSDASYDDLLKFEDSTKAVEDAFRRLRRPGGIGIQMLTSARHADMFEFRLSDAREGPYGLNAEERAMVKRTSAGETNFRQAHRRNAESMSGRSASAIRSSTGWQATCGGMSAAGPSP